MATRIGLDLTHELKNSITAVKALVQLGLRSPSESASHARLALIEGELARMQERLRRHVSRRSGPGELAPAAVALGPLVAEALRALSARAQAARVRLLAHGDAVVEADRRRLTEALLDLVANAIEATPPGGEVVVEARPSGDGAELVVRDTGRGMCAETLERLGTPFFTTRADGSGLGVALARSVLASHGGSLRYESEPGRGTVVRAALPARVAARSGAAAAHGGRGE